MKAVLYTRYGKPEVLKLQETDRPVPKENELLIKMHATTVNSGDVHLRSGSPFAIRLFFGLTRPRKQILGFVVAGEIESVGKAVQTFTEGDQVFGTTGMHFGAYAEYVCLPADAVLTIKPKGITWEEAAAIPFGGNTALYFLQKAKIKPGQKVLIYGASGALGTAAVQLANSFGAEVTGVCSTANKQMVEALGAHHVIDYTREDFSKAGKKYDVIFDTVGKSSFAGCIQSLTKNGILLLSAAGPADMIRGVWTSITSGKKVISGVMKETKDQLVFVKQLVEEGKFRAVIDSVYPLEKISDAHSYVEAGHKKGNVVITI